MSDDRSERLRKRRKQSRDKAAETDEPSKPSKPNEPDETVEESEDESGSVKKNRTGTYMYLPEEQSRELSYQFKRLSAEYEREYGEDFEKNRHFYPLVISYGLDSFDGWDVSDVRDRLDEMGVLDDE